jgi:hypothetical protein
MMEPGRQVTAIYQRLDGRTLIRVDALEFDAADSLCASESVSAVNPEAADEKPRTFATVCGCLGR